MHSMLFVFLDGLGLGPADSPDNPLAREVLPAFERLAGQQRWTNQVCALNEPDHLFRPIDATLDVEGLPQSGTGQATLFTGVNCALKAGRHFGPFPHSATKPVLASQNIFHQIKALSLPFSDPVAFANAYPSRFFDQARRRKRWTVTTRCCLEAHVPIRNEEALRSGKALAADLTNQGWQRLLGRDVALISEEEAGQRLAHLSTQHAFTLFEYYLTDKAGHNRIDRSAASILHALDRFLASLIEAIDLEKQLLIVTSDHGNLEDLSTKSHTRNPVPFLAYGAGARAFGQVRALTDVTPAIVSAFSNHYAKEDTAAF